MIEKCVGKERVQRYGNELVMELTLAVNECAG
jgi:hypothetical protein